MSQPQEDAGDHPARPPVGMSVLRGTRPGRGRWGRRPIDLETGQYFDPLWPEAIKVAARQLRARAVPVVLIARFFCTSKSTVYQWLRRQG